MTRATQYLVLRTIYCKAYVTVGIKESMNTATTALTLSRFFENARLALISADTAYVEVGFLTCEEPED